MKRIAFLVSYNGLKNEGAGVAGWSGPGKAQSRDLSRSDKISII